MIWAILSVVAFAPPQQPLEFEVASVRVSKGPQQGAPRVLGLDQTRVTFRSVGEPLLVLLKEAYGVSGNAIDGPAWLASVNVDVTAKAPMGATPDQLRLMLQQLLKERFALAVHKETRVEPAYVLTVAKGGIKFKENTDPDLQPMRPGDRGRPGDRSRDRSGFPIIAPHFSGSIGRTTIKDQNIMKHTAVGMPIQSLLPLIGGQLEWPLPTVVDRTGLTGKYDYHLEYQITPPGRPQPTEFSGPPIGEALEKQLGLHLEKKKVLVEMLIVDHIERTPTDN